MQNFLSIVLTVCAFMTKDICLGRIWGQNFVNKEKSPKSTFLLFIKAKIRTLFKVSFAMKLLWQLF